MPDALAKPMHPPLINAKEKPDFMGVTFIAAPRGVGFYLHQ
jgi:hypothetical protein